MHPIIPEIYSDEKNTNLFFKWISNQVENKERLKEFFKWHLEVILEVINEMDKTRKIDFLEEKEAKLWATEFLEKYEQKIRKMGNASNQIFDRFHELKTEFKKIVLKKCKYEKESNDTIQVFLNKKELLIEKIIFSYREVWFLANQITESDFKLG